MIEKVGGLSSLSRAKLTLNLQYLMKTNRITSVDLARGIGVSAELIGKLKNGSLNNPSLRVLIGISQYFDISLDDLAFTDMPLVKFDQNIKKRITYIPVINWDKIKDWNKEAAERHITVNKDLGKQTFALELDHDYGTFQKGSFIFIDTGLKPKNNDYVLVVNNENAMFHVKKLIIDDAYYLQSIITDINNVVKYIESKNEIYGVLVGYQKTEFLKG